MGVAERQQYLTIAVRDFLNEGGKLIHDGELTQYQGLPGFESVGGLWYGLNGDPTAPCFISASLRDDCLLLADDFRQYWLGAYTRESVDGPDGVEGIDDPIDGYEGDFGGPVADGDNPLDEAGEFEPTSDVLPVGQFPQFASWAAARYDVPAQNAPFAGTRYAAAEHEDDSYMRLTKTVNLAGATSAQLQFQLSLDAEEGYDHLIVEAHTPGQDNWTTLPEIGGATSTAAPQECEPNGFLFADHPFLAHYLGGPGCAGPGTSGTWNAITGSTNGYQQVAYSLAPYLGQQVELSISYVTDPSTGGAGAFVDDTRIIVNGNVVSADGFEGATSTWSVPGEPPGSPPNTGDWEIGPPADVVGATATDDTLLLGFGLEQLATDAERVELVDRALGGLIGP
jgi:hypothetical protein